MPIQGWAAVIDARPALAEEPAVVVPPDAYLWASVPWGVLHIEQQLQSNVQRVDWTTLLPVEVLLEVRKRTSDRDSLEPPPLNHRVNA